MKLRDFGETAIRDWFTQVLEWSRKKITFDDNIDCVFLTANINTTETVLRHNLGRSPKYVLEAAIFPGGTTGGISLTKAPTIDTLYIKKSTAGQSTLLLI
ncbi:MAG: hypothetical protein RL316_458 [Bacteroidota bacterium]|jgi:hypothetical protein